MEEGGGEISLIGGDVGGGGDGGGVTGECTIGVKGGSTRGLPPGEDANAASAVADLRRRLEERRDWREGGGGGGGGGVGGGGGASEDGG